MNTAIERKKLVFELINLHWKYDLTRWSPLDILLKQAAACLLRCPGRPSPVQSCPWPAATCPTLSGPAAVWLILSRPSVVLSPDQPSTLSRQVTVCPTLSEPSTRKPLFWYSHFLHLLVVFVIIQHSGVCLTSSSPSLSSPTQFSWSCLLDFDYAILIQSSHDQFIFTSSQLMMCSVVEPLVLGRLCLTVIFDFS